VLGRGPSYRGWARSGGGGAESRKFAKLKHVRVTGGALTVHFSEGWLLWQVLATARSCWVCVWCGGGCNGAALLCSLRVSVGFGCVDGGRDTHVHSL